MNEKGFEVHGRADEGRIIEEEFIEFKEGLRWECIRCTWCCRQPWAVNMTWFEHDRARADPRAKDLAIDRIELDEGSGLTHPYFVIEGKCPMLREKDSACSLYPDWFYTCATYPFLLMPSGTLKVHSKCRGLGQGPIIDRDKMREKILKERRRAGMIV
ncbi:MAG: YkgJ family cysteine cluster protein [Thermoplasmatota archaeon]